MGGKVLFNNQNLLDLTEKKMQEIIQQNLAFKKQMLSKKEAVKLFTSGPDSDGA